MREKKTKKYRTTSIDEATFLALKGHVPFCQGVGDRSAFFIFNHAESLNEHIKMFWSKDAQIGLHSWLSTRQQLKNITASQARVAADDAQDEKFGQAYYYKVGDAIQHAIFGRSKVHQERYKSGNFFYKKEDALKVNP